MARVANDHPAALESVLKGFVSRMNRMKNLPGAGPQQKKRIDRIIKDFNNQYEGLKLGRNIDHYLETWSWPKMKVTPPDVGGHIPIEDLGRMYKAETIPVYNRTKFISDEPYPGPVINWANNPEFNAKKHFLHSMPAEESILKGAQFKNKKGGSIKYRTGGFFPREETKIQRATQNN